MNGYADCGTSDPETLPGNKKGQAVDTHNKGGPWAEGGSYLPKLQTTFSKGKLENRLVVPGLRGGRGEKRGVSVTIKMSE